MSLSMSLIISLIISLTFALVMILSDSELLFFRHTIVQFDIQKIEMKVSHRKDQIWANCFVPTKQIIIPTKFKGILLQNFFHLCFQSFISFHFILGLSFQVFLYIFSFTTFSFNSFHLTFFGRTVGGGSLVFIKAILTKCISSNAFTIYSFTTHSLIRWFVDSLVRSFWWI